MNPFHARRRALLLAITCLLLTLAGSSRGALGEQNQSGPTVGEQLVGACRATGGIEDVWVHRTGAGWQWTITTCRGGALDGLQCKEAPGLSPWCAFKLTQPIETLDVVPEGGVELVDRQPITALPPNPDRPTAAEDVTGGATVIANQQGSTVVDNALNQARICRALGGEAHFGEHWGDSGDGEVVVSCVGGLLDGLWCSNDTRRGTRCMFVRLLGPADTAAVTPASGAEQSSEQGPTPTQPAVAPTPTAMPTVAPTAMPAEPTAAPTTAPAEPTAAPTTAPPPPKNDTSVPPGGAEDPAAPEPTVTPVVLT